MGDDNFQWVLYAKPRGGVTSLAYLASRSSGPPAHVTFPCLGFPVGHTTPRPRNPEGGRRKEPRKPLVPGHNDLSGCLAAVMAQLQTPDWPPFIPVGSPELQGFLRGLLVLLLADELLILVMYT